MTAENPEATATEATAPTTPPTDTAAASASAKPPELPPVDFVEGTPAAAPDKAPTLAFTAPFANQVLPAAKAGDFEVKMNLKGWDAPAGGNHVHLILDGKPYYRVDDAKKPVKLKELDANLAEGEHVLVAFPSRHTHESVKPVGKASPLAVVTFWVGKRGTPTWKPTDPTFIYSRPKGANDGPPPPEGILVDWYLANAELGDGKFSIDATLTGPGLESGKKVSIKEWKPWRIKNVRDGKYSLHMTLLDKDGKPVPGAWNDVTREFTVDQTKADTSHAAPAPAASSSSAPAAGSAAPAAPKH
jgi:hypothetical protein